MQATCAAYWLDALPPVLRVSAGRLCGQPHFFELTPRDVAIEEQDVSAGGIATIKMSTGVRHDEPALNAGPRLARTGGTVGIDRPTMSQRCVGCQDPIGG